MKILLFLLSPLITFASPVVVTTQTGTIIGSTVNYEGKPVKKYLGIPFAEPPVGELRFRKTVPVKPWAEPLVADTFPPSCVQYYPFDYPWVDRMPGHSEDCLYLNIWVPQNASLKNPKAVMFWIYSGGFSSGSSRLPVYDGHVLAAEGDVIVVTMNYRVGIFGFLTTETEEAPGNMGLYDVLEALKWINKNIKEFGGDENNITLFGNSAGAFISGFLTVSPLSVGLFQRIVMQSGSAAYMGIYQKKRNFEIGQKIADAIGCSLEFFTLKDNPQAVIQCLRDVPADILIEAERSLMPTAIMTFSPIYGDEFLPVDPLKAILSGNFQHVDILAGNVQDEGSFLLAAIAPEFWGPYGELAPKINKTKGEDILLRMFHNYAFKHDVVNYYLSGLSENDYDVVRSQIYHSYGDFIFICPTIYLVEKFAERVENVYYYYFEHQNFETVFAPWMGVTHFSEVPFVFGRPLDSPSVYTEEEIELSKALIELWANFAKVGIPFRGSALESRLRDECPSARYSLKTAMANPFDVTIQETLKFKSPSQCSRIKYSPLGTIGNDPSLAWNTYSTSNPHVQQFYKQKIDKSYWENHEANCEFFRPYFQTY